MINYVSGVLADIGDGEITVEAGGIGYGIYLSAGAFAELPPVGSELKIYTYFSVSEDSQSLYGFIYKDEREMFGSLIRVNGVGPKAAMAVLGTLSVDELRMAIAFEDASAISRAPGIGKKTAERIILDLKDKIGLIGAASVGTGSGAYQAAGLKGAMDPGHTPMQEAIDALAALGYSRVEAGRAVSRVELSSDMSTEEILKAALKNISLM